MKSSLYKDTYFLLYARPIILGGLLLIIFSYFYLDLPLALYFQPHHEPLASIAQIVTDAIDPKYQYLLWPALFVLLRYLLKKKTWGNRCLLIAISVPVTNLIVELLKWFFGRARPELLFSEHIFGFTFFGTTDAYYSFPSGHACTAAAIMGAWACFYPRWSLLFALASIVLASTRVILTYHYLSDIVMGIMIGLFISQWLYLIMKKQGISFGKKNRASPVLAR